MITLSLSVVVVALLDRESMTLRSLLCKLVRVLNALRRWVGLTHLGTAIG